jgi:hypothetical protein
METINTGFVCPYGTMVLVFLSAAPLEQPYKGGTMWKRLLENAGANPATAEGVISTKPFPQLGSKK